MAATVTDSEFQRLPVEPDNGFPQQFLLSFDGKVYRLTFSVSFLTLEPFKVWAALGSSSPERVRRQLLTVPLGVARPRAQLPVPFEGEPERMIYALPQDELFLVLKLARDDLPEHRRTLGITRPVLDIPIRLADLVFLFRRIHIARGNLIGPGSFGSEVLAGVAVYVD